MDPFDLMFRRPIPVKGSATKNDFDFDEGLIDRVLGTPNKIDIPERYIPEREQLAPEEEQRRIQKAEAICRLLSKTSLGPAPLVLPPKSSNGGQSHHSPFGSANSSPSKKNTFSAGPGAAARLHANKYSATSQPSTPNLRNFSAKRNSYHQDLNPISSASVIEKSSLSSTNSPVRRPVHSSLRKSSATSNVVGGRNASKFQRSTLCDWSLAGVTAPYSPHNNTSLSRHSFLSSDSEPAGNLFENQFVQYSNKPHHSYNSSYSSTSSGRSSSDKEDLLHLQHDLAKEVTQKSRLVAVRAVTTSPSPQLRFSGDYNSYRDPSPPSPVDLPTVQQREGFFT